MPILTRSCGPGSSPRPGVEPMRPCTELFGGELGEHIGNAHGVMAVGMLSWPHREFLIHYAEGADLWTICGHARFQDLTLCRGGACILLVLTRHWVPRRDTKQASCHVASCTKAFTHRPTCLSTTSSLPSSWLSSLLVGEGELPSWTKGHLVGYYSLASFFGRSAVVYAPPRSASQASSKRPREGSRLPSQRRRGHVSSVVGSGCEFGRSISLMVENTDSFSQACVTEGTASTCAFVRYIYFASSSVREVWTKPDFPSKWARLPINILTFSCAPQTPSGPPVGQPAKLRSPNARIRDPDGQPAPRPYTPAGAVGLPFSPEARRPVEHGSLGQLSP